MRFKSEAQRRLVMRLMKYLKKSNKVSRIGKRTSSNIRSDKALFNFAKKLKAKINQRNFYIEEEVIFNRFWKKTEGKNMFNAPGVKPGKKLSEMTAKELEITKSHKPRLIKNTKFAIRKVNSYLKKIKFELKRTGKNKLVYNKGKDNSAFHAVKRGERFLETFTKKLKDLEKL